MHSHLNDSQNLRGVGGWDAGRLHHLEAVGLAEGDLGDAGASSKALEAGTSLTALGLEGGCRGHCCRCGRRVMGHHSVRKVKSFSMR